ncbi:MAG: response regulator transcription factor [Dehalococcoidia bacterium]|nr:MAG: response regulator transcription factor [Dehalococcoidia bacterium]
MPVDPPRQSGAAIRVMLVDDHEVVRRGLQSILDRNPELQVVGEAESVASALRECGIVHPDVVVMDLRLPDGSGVTACRDIRATYPDVKVLILTSHADEDALFSAVLAGAAGYVLKDLDTVGIQRAIITVGRGGSLLDPQMTTRLLERMRQGSAQHPADDQFATLTPQEDRILDMIGDGMTNRQIADRLSLSEKTVKNYVSELYAKLHVDRRTQAATLATERRLRKE